MSDRIAPWELFWTCRIYPITTLLPGAPVSPADEVRNAAAARQRRLQLQTAYGQAMMLSRGFGAEEALAAFTLAQELATGADNSIERFATHYGLWVSSVMRGELQRAVISSAGSGE